MATSRKMPKLTRKTSTRALPAARIGRQPLQSRSAENPVLDEVGEDDLVLLDLDGESLFWVKREDYQKTPLPDLLADELRLLTNQGTVLADVPRGSLPGVGAACFLVNLASIRQRSAKLRR